MRKGDGDMKEKKRVWFTFNLCEADAFEQYLEKMALQGWFLESVGAGAVRGSRLDFSVQQHLLADILYNR